MVPFVVIIQINTLFIDTVSVLTLAIFARVIIMVTDQKKIMLTDLNTVVLDS